MAKLALNKSALSREKQRKTSYERYLPSLELKQKQLLAERKKAQQELAQHRAEIEEANDEVHRKLPMLANKTIDLTGLVKVNDVRMVEENMMGTYLPKLEQVDYIVADYGYLIRPRTGSTNWRGP